MESIFPTLISISTEMLNLVHILINCFVLRMAMQASLALHISSTSLDNLPYHLAFYYVLGQMG